MTEVAFRDATVYNVVDTYSVNFAFRNYPNGSSVTQGKYQGPAGLEKNRVEFYDFIRVASTQPSQYSIRLYGRHRTDYPAQQGVSRDELASRGVFFIPDLRNRTVFGSGLPTETSLFDNGSIMNLGQVNHDLVYSLTASTHLVVPRGKTGSFVYWFGFSVHFCLWIGRRNLRYRDNTMQLR
jgi:hypothetical protein